MKARRLLRRRDLAAFLPAVLSLLAPSLAAAADQRAILTLYVNHVAKEEIAVVLRDGDVLVAPADLTSAGLIAFAGRVELLPGGNLLSLASLSPALSYTLDEAALALRLEAPVRMLQTSVISLSPSTPPGLEQRRDTSAFVNYAVRAGFPTEADGFLETGLSVDGNLLTSTLTVSSQLGAVRGLTSFTVDDRAGLRRWVVGDASVSGGALGAGLFVGGLSVSKTYTIDPYFIHTPSLGFTGSTPTPATLDVYVNGVLVKSQAIPPGPFQVQNVQAPTGSGDVRYVLRDIFGREQAVSSPYYQGSTSLAKGLSEYTYALGARRNDLATESFSYGAMGLLAYHRYGFSDRLTAGARFEGAAGLVSGGPSATLVLPVGQIDAEVAGSAATGGAGVAALAAYTFASRRLGGGIVVHAASDRYATLSLAPEDDRERLRVNAFTSVAVAARASVSAQYAFWIDRDLGTSFHVGLTSTIQLTRRISLALGAGRSYAQQTGASIDASAGLTISLDHGVTASVGARQNAGSHEAYLESNKPLPASNGFGYRVDAAAGDVPNASAVGQYQGPYGRYQVTLAASPLGPTGEIEAAGALVYVQGAGVLATRPVQDGFAVVRVPGAGGVRAFLNNQEVGRTNGNGDVVLPTLLPYYGNRISIADTDLALDRTVSAVERTIAPPYRGGALVLFDAAPARFFRGTLVVEAGGKSVVPAYGEVTVREPSGDVTSPLGKRGEFELSGLTPGSREARIVHTGGTCTFQLEVPRAVTAVTELGERRCTQ